jgi:hypothetical protein
MLKKDGDEASRSSFPDTEWKTTGNFLAGRYDEFRYLLMVAGLAQGTSSLS